MSAAEIDLTDASPLSAVFDFAVDSPTVEIFRLKHNDQVVLLHSMDGGNPEDYQVIYVFNRSEKQVFHNVKTGQKGQLLLVPFSNDASRTVKAQVQTG